MSLNSLPFLFFLLTVFFIFQLTKDKYRWAFLLVASYGFYAALGAPQLLIALALVTSISYICGIRLTGTIAGARRKFLFWIGTGSCVIILVVLKYMPFLLSKGNFSFLSGKLLIFIGVSYFVIQAISYMADVHIGKKQPERHLGYYALYLSFFPKLLQGPIERADTLLPQLKKRYEFDYEAIRYGMIQFIWGLFKKVVVADRLALFVDPIYGDVSSYKGIALLAATYFYAIQIYCDFSGYTDMALGSARIFNIKMTQNFHTPYFATSIADFWRRWHITLSTWLRDYLFLPLSYFFSRRIRSLYIFRIDSNVAIYCSSAIITFGIAGIWHGSAWSYIIWGLIHGLYLSFSNITRKIRKKIRKRIRFHGRLSNHLILAQRIFCFHLVALSWIFFRSSKLSDSLYILNAILRDVKNIYNISYIRLQFRGLGLRESDIILAVAFIFVIFLVDVVEVKRGNIFEIVLSSPGWLRWAVYYMILIAILYFAPYNSANNFIYMQF